MRKRNKSPIGGKFAATRRTVGPRGRRRWVAASAGLATIAAVFGLQPATSFAKGKRSLRFRHHSSPRAELFY
jgi:hypothetical protein